MTFAEFHNALRVLLNIDYAEIRDAGIDMSGTEWHTFSSNPHRWFIRACDADAAKLWAIIESRQQKGADMKIALAVGQAWMPTKPGTGWRYLCEVDGEPGTVRYRLPSGNMRRDWAWQFRDWCERFECILKESSDPT